MAALTELPLGKHREASGGARAFVLDVAPAPVHLSHHRELPDEDRANILAIAQRPGAVKNVHDLKTRRAGLSTFIQLHLALDSAMTLAEAHAVSDRVEQELLKAYPGAEIIIHQDPL